MNESLFTDQPMPSTSSGGDLFTDEPAPKDIGHIESFARGAANNFPLAPQAIAVGEKFLPGGKSYSENLSDWNQKAQQAKAAHPVTYGAGAVGGAIAPLLIPGVGEALEAAPIAGNAVYGAANAISNTDLSKNQGQALKEGAIGGVLGGTIGGVMNKLMPAASTLENAAASKGLSSTGIGQKYLAEMKPEEFEAAKDFVMKNGLVGTNKEEILQKALGMQRDLGESIGNIGKELDNAGIKASEDDILGAVTKLQNKASETASLENPELRKLSIWHTKGANDIFNKIGDDPSWQSIQKLKEAYGKAAFSDTGEVKNEASKNVYFTLRDMLKGLTEKAQESPQLAQEYKDALGGYHTIDPVIEGLQKAVGAERAGTGGHAAGHGFLPRLIRSLPGQSNPATNLGTAALATAFSPHLGPLMALPTLTNPAIQSKAFSAIGRNLPGITQGMTQEMIDYLESKYGKSNP